MQDLELIARAQAHSDSVALRAPTGDVTYRDLLQRSNAVAAALLKDREDLREARVAYRLPAGPDYVSVQWAIWRAGGIAVPLSLSATTNELQYTLTDADVTCAVVQGGCSDEVLQLYEEFNLRIVVLDSLSEVRRNLPPIDTNRRAMILYTSGTTSKPKGVVTTHDNIQSQISTLVDAWEWSSNDSIPLFLPLHHIHGIINVMSCALWSGARIEPFPRFEMDLILQRVSANAYSVFMAVPTIYIKLIAALEAFSPVDREPVIAGFKRMRLMVSGSAALPATVHARWTDLTGQVLLERYGMTEIGMGLSNPYHGERRAGAVGQPLSGVQIRLVSEQGKVVHKEDSVGEIQVRGPSVFKEYWCRPQVTADSFDDGWFRTGDMAVIRDGYFHIMGRQSVDIIKSGGYKLSALEIEATLMDHPAIEVCAVVGLADDTWGEAVAAALVLKAGQTIDLETLRAWCQDRLSPYKIPKRMLVLDALPRNAMGKVTKPAVSAMF